MEDYELEALLELLRDKISQASHFGEVESYFRLYDSLKKGSVEPRSDVDYLREFVLFCKGWSDSEDYGSLSRLEEQMIVDFVMRNIKDGDSDE